MNTPNNPIPWQQYIFYGIILGLTGIGAYLKILPTDYFATAVAGVVGHGFGTSSNGAKIAQIIADLAAQVATPAPVVQTPAPANAASTAPERGATTPTKG